jgi:glycosyltransferase involved in cell wall biosynthesis
LKVAIVHDWLTGMRGGEKVLLSLLRLFPKAPIYTLLHVRGSVAPEIEGREIHTTFVQRLPDVARRYRYYLPLFPKAVASFDLRSYDLVVSSSHCVAKGAKAAPGAVHVCYCHTPMRYVWDRFDEYFGPRRVGRAKSLAAAVVARGLRRWDVATAAGVHHFVANSAYVAGRIERYYERPAAAVIPPPVDVDFFTPGPAEREAAAGGYDLVVSALAPYKRLELALEAYRGTGRPLKIVGSGPEEARLRAIAPPEVSFLGRVDDPALRDLYRGCRAVIMPGVEDFGIVPLEAMACGRPAVVFAFGGGPESVVAGETGILFQEPTAASLKGAVDSLSSLRFNTAALRRRAEAHSRQVFEERLLGFVRQTLGASAAW